MWFVRTFGLFVSMFSFYFFLLVEQMHFWQQTNNITKNKYTDEKIKCDERRTVVAVINILNYLYLSVLRLRRYILLRLLASLLDYFRRQCRLSIQKNDGWFNRVLQATRTPFLLSFKKMKWNVSTLLLVVSKK